MNKLSQTFLVLIATCCFVTGYSMEQRKISINEGWKFHLGSTSNAEQPDYDDAKWRTLDLPHDWSVEPLLVQRNGITIGPFSKMSEGGIDTGQTLGGEGWYRKEFTLSTDDVKKRHYPKKCVNYIRASPRASPIACPNIRDLMFLWAVPSSA